MKSSLTEVSTINLLDLALGFILVVLHIWACMLSPNPHYFSKHSYRQHNQHCPVSL